MDFDASDVFAEQAQPETPPDPSPQGGQTGDERGGTPPAETWEVPGVGRVNRDELIKGYLRTQDYTRKTMALSNREREFDTLQRQGQAMEAALLQARNLLTNRKMLTEYLKQLPGAEPETAPDQILTTAEAQALMKRQLGESQTAFDQRLAQAEERIMTQAYQTQYESAINSTLRSIGERYPTLRTVPGMEVLLRQAVGSQQPGTLDDALALFEQAAEFYANRLQQVAKTVAAPPNNPLNRGIEPPTGGGTPAPSDGDMERFSGIKDPGLRSLVIRDVERALFGGRQ